jgi:HEAT repeat protein
MWVIILSLALFNQHPGISGAISLQFPARWESLHLGREDPFREVRFGSNRAKKATADQGLGREAPSSVSKLLKDFDNADLAIRFPAIVALSRIEVGRSTVFDLLLTARSHPCPISRAAILEAIATLNPSSEETGTTVSAALHDPNPHVRGTAATLLGDFRHQAAKYRDLLCKHLRDEDPSVRVRMAYALVALGETQHPATVSIFVEALPFPKEARQSIAISGLILLGKNAAEAVQPIVTAIKQSSSSAFRGRALLALAEIQPKESTTIAFIANMMKEHDSFVRCSAGLALSQIGPPAVPSVAQLLDEDNSHVVKIAIQVLKNIGPSADSTIPKLKHLLQNRDPEVRRDAAEAITVITRRVGKGAKQEVPGK